MKSFICILITSILLISCSDNISPNNSSNVLFQQVPGCGNIILPKVASDSSFAYSFNKSLKISFCLKANCCPDTNRFDYVYTINNDVIDFNAIDTAAHLCDCTCPYTLEIEINDLPKDSYQFVCTYDDSLYYNEWVFR